MGWNRLGSLQFCIILCILDFHKLLIINYFLFWSNITIIGLNDLNRVDFGKLSQLTDISILCFNSSFCIAIIKFAAASTSSSYCLSNSFKLSSSIVYLYISNLFLYHINILFTFNTLLWCFHILIHLTLFCWETSHYL